MSSTTRATAPVPAGAPPRRHNRSGASAPGRPRRRPRRRNYLPYLLLGPAIVLELAIHVVPMFVGVWMSLLELTQFHIRDWSAAPFAGLENYRATLDIDTATGRELLHSFWVTIAYATASVGLSWLLGLAAAVFLQRPFRGRAILRTLFLTPYALPVYAAVITWSFLFQ